MSKYFKAFLAIFPVILLVLNNCSGQDIDASVTISAAAAEVNGRFTSPRVDRHFSILREFAGFSGLADRVSDVRLENSDGKTVAFKQFVPGEYVAESGFTAWHYRVDLSPAKRQQVSGHTSWLSTDVGLLFLRDVLPVLKKGSKGTVAVQLPNGWSSSKGVGRFAAWDIDATVVLIGKDLRPLTVAAAGMEIKIFLAGKWQFQDDQLAAFASEIIQNYSERLGPLLMKQVDIVYAPFPQPSGLGAWEGDTSSNTVVIVSSDMPFQTQSAQRLHEQLRHELFHLWFPNSVSLTGNYDWFYEGFALYESLKLGVALNRLRFDDFLDTLGRAITIDSMLTDRRSLIEASKTRSGVADTTVYARGMLAAFLTDLELLKRSGGKESVSTLLRSIFKKYNDAALETDANSAILTAIASPKIARFVNGSESTNWANELRPAGIEVSSQPGLTDLKVTNKQSNSQKKLLDKLGYNNWRRSPVIPK
jgi:hypothetical protein